MGIESSYEAETIFGLEEFAERELRNRFGSDVNVTGRSRVGRVAFVYSGAPTRLNDLGTVVAVYRVLSFDVSRPKALLGHGNLQRLLNTLREIVRLYAPGTLTSFHLSAAGSGSPVFLRLKGEIATGLRLPHVDGPGHLSIAVRPATDHGWETLVRLSPRPLAARAWRVCDLPGALNATIARVMAELATPAPNERYLNLACGSGTLLIERLSLGPARLAVGIDRDLSALECAARNVIAAGDVGRIALLQGDAATTPLSDASFDTIVVDLPFGMLVGSKAENERLYPSIVAEAARLVVPGGCLVAITASKRIFEAALAANATRWSLERTVPISVPFRSGYVHPSIYVARRTLSL